ncbi:MAG: hypothetical protein ACK4P3_07680 [Fimbriimonadaceae bacterium]
MRRLRTIGTLIAAAFALFLLAGCMGSPSANDGGNTIDQLGKAAVEMEKKEGVAPPPPDEAGQSAPQPVGQ